MIVIKYRKVYPSSIVSHIDLLRGMQRLFKRTGMEVAYSQGFNPHMNLYLSPALSLGIESQCEYVFAEVNDNENALDLFNRFAPQGIVGVKVFDGLTKNPNLAGVIDRAEYVVSGQGVSSLIQRLNDDGALNITYLDRNVSVVKDVRSMVYSATADNDRVRMVIACGNANLKADRLVKSLCTDLQLDYDSVTIEKTAMYVGNVDVDQYLQSKKTE